MSKVITLQDINGGKSYDLGRKQYNIDTIKAFGIVVPGKLNNYFPPIVSPMNRLDLTGKWEVTAITIKNEDKYFVQLQASGQNTTVSTDITLDIDSQQVFEEVIDLQIHIQEIK